MTDVVRSDGGAPATWERTSLVDILDRVLGTGVVITGEITLSIADVDLVFVSLNAIIASVRPDGPLPMPAAGPVVREAW
jgi:gas vesicle protein GvpA/GvpJ/GvpM family